jgi:hypothetical protein
MTVCFGFPGRTCWVSGQPVVFLRAVLCWLNPCLINVFGGLASNGSLIEK